MKYRYTYAFPLEKSEQTISTGLYTVRAETESFGITIRVSK